MIRRVQIYIEGNVVGDYEQIELFNDEKIIVNSSIQNLQDISKVFTDFSQSFTIPASPTNNRIMHHFYESDIDIDTDANGVPLWNPNVRRNAFIEIDFTPFRSGKIALEKANIVNGKVESYTIGFYGSVINLKDKFGKDKLSDLDLSFLDIPYTFNNVRDIIKGISSYTSIKFPLISSKRLWSYGNSTTTDISINGGAINYTELFPALKISSILAAIENKYVLNFTGNFLLNNRFTNAYLWCKNTETFSVTTGDVSLSIGSYNKQDGLTTIYNQTTDDGTVYMNNVNGVKDSIVIRNHNGANGTSNTRTLLQCNVVSVTSASLEIDLYNNDIFVRTINGNTNTWNDLINVPNSQITTGRYSVKVRTSTPLIGQIRLYLEQPYNGSRVLQYNLYGTTNETWSAKISFNKYMPEMTIEDFFTSLLKTFNLTCYGVNTNTFKLEPLDDFYSRGALVDITENVITDSIEIKKALIFKTLNFEHAKSENFLNVEYYEENKKTREYGDARITFENYDEGEYNIKTGFSDMLQTELTTNLQVGYSLGKFPSYEAQTPQPLLLYSDTTITGVSFKLTNGSGAYETITQYVPMGAETTSNGKKYSLHFSSEISNFASERNNKINIYSLYETYYASYLANLYNPKCRLTTINTIFPISLLTNLKLYDRVIVKDKRYLINDIKSDITSGECTLNLINDFRPIINATYTVTIDGAGGTTDIDIVVPDGATITIGSPTTGVVASPTTFTDDGTCTITYPANPTPITYINSEISDRIDTEDYINLITEASTRTAIYVTYTITYQNGTTYTQTILLGYDN